MESLSPPVLFHPFSRLPPEIRHSIWKLALPDADVPIIFPLTRKDVGPLIPYIGATPRISFVNHEARAIVTTWLHPKSNSHGFIRRLDLSRDVLLVLRSIDDLSRFATSVRNVAILAGMLHQGPRLILHILDYMPNTQKIFFIQGEGFERSLTGMQPLYGVEIRSDLAVHMGPNRYKMPLNTWSGVQPGIEDLPMEVVRQDIRRYIPLLRQYDLLEGFDRAKVLESLEMYPARLLRW